VSTFKIVRTGIIRVEQTLSVEAENPLTALANSQNADDSDWETVPIDMSNMREDSERTVSLIQSSEDEEVKEVDSFEQV